MKVLREKELDQYREDHKDFFEQSFKMLNINFGEHNWKRKDVEREVVVYLFEKQNIDMHKCIRIGDISAAIVRVMFDKYIVDWDFQKTRDDIKRLYGEKTPAEILMTEAR